MMGPVEGKKWPGTAAETKFAEYLVRTAGGHFVTVVRRGVGEMLGVRVPGQTFVVHELMAAASSEIDRLQRENAELRNLADRFKLEAQGHAMEARTANSTIYEIYQIVTGTKGEPGNWRGAEPVRKYVSQLMIDASNHAADAETVRREREVERRRAEAAESEVKRYRETLHMIGAGHGSPIALANHTLQPQALASTGGQHHGN